MLPFLKEVSPYYQGWIALLIGFILMLGALDKLNFLQDILNMFLIVAGFLLILWGLHKTNLLHTLRNLKESLKKDTSHKQ